MEHFRAHAHGIRHALGADRHDHEFLDVDRIVRMRAAIDDVHHRRRQNAGIGAADIPVERHRAGFGGGFRDGQRHAEDGVGTETGFVLRTVEVDHQHVDHALVGSVEAGKFVADLAVDGVDCLQDALAAIAGLVAVALLVGLVGPRGGARRHSCAAGRAIFKRNIHFNGRVAPAVEDFAGVNVDDFAHGDGPLADRCVCRK